VSIIVLYRQFLTQRILLLPAAIGRKNEYIYEILKVADLHLIQFLTQRILLLHAAMGRKNEYIYIILKVADLHLSQTYVHLLRYHLHVNSFGKKN